MSKKRIIQAETDEQIKNFVSTYNFWAILDGSEVLASSEFNNADFDKDLFNAIDIGLKRGKQYLVVRVGSSERNSRTNDEMIINLSNYANPVIDTNFASSNNNTPIILNGFPSSKPNNAGLTAQDIQTYLNGALERQQKEFEAMNKSTLAGLQAEMKKQQAEQEILLLKQMHEQQMNFERKLLAREREEMERKRQELEIEIENFEYEKQQQKEGIKGFISTLAGFGRDFVDDIIEPDKNKTNELKGQETEIHQETHQAETIQFNDVEEDNKDDDDSINILNGVEKMNDDDLRALQELITERLNNTNQENTQNDENL